jgi:hypothetical protein
MLSAIARRCTMYRFCLAGGGSIAQAREDKIKVPRVILYNQKEKGHGNRLVIQATTSRAWPTDLRCR